MCEESREEGRPSLAPRRRCRFPLLCGRHEGALMTAKYIERECAAVSSFRELHGRNTPARALTTLLVRSQRKRLNP